MSSSNTFDVLIIGAGLSGIGTAYWLQAKCPGKSYTILEGRERLGGTWDLFRYPGIRSDSDMFTFGFRFRPWTDPQSLSSGPAILRYLRETAEEHGIHEKIRYRHQVRRADWSSEERLWTVQVETPDGVQTVRCRFLYLCTGYYRYDQAYRPHFEGEEAFKGPILHPQFWPEDLDFTGKRVVVIGSGATAVTIVPSMAGKAAHVTMLQRSPTYITNLPNRNGLFARLQKIVSPRTAYTITRRRNLVLGMLFFRLAKAAPRFVKSWILNAAAKQLPKGYPVEQHFAPRYNPWDQRLCVVPDGDLFTAVREGKASVVTDTIERFIPTGVRTSAGTELAADVIVVATGLSLRLLGGAEVYVDGKKIEPQEVMIYKGMMVSDVPNLALAFGYTNASWTLKTDLTANWVCKLLNHMERKGYEVVIPRCREEASSEPFLNLQSGYIERAKGVLPKQGARRPWRVYQNYFLDMLSTRYGKVEDGVLEFLRRERNADIMDQKNQHGSS